MISSGGSGVFAVVKHEEQCCLTSESPESS